MVALGGAMEKAVKYRPGKKAQAYIPFAYVLLALLLTYPLLLHLSSHVPGSSTWAFDEYTFIWNMWWFKYSLFDLHTSPLRTDYIFFPVGSSLLLYTYDIFNCLLALPLQFHLPLPLASNLVLLFTWVMSAWGAYLLALYLLRRSGLTEHVRLAAFAAGCLYAFASNRHIYAALGHYDMVSTQWLPFYALFFIRTLEEPGWKNPVLAGLFATMAMLCEMIFGTFLVIFSVVYLLLRVTGNGASCRGDPSGRPYRGCFARLAVLATVVLVTYAPLLIPIMREMFFGRYELAGWGDALKLSTDLMGFFTPTALHPTWKGSWAAELRAVIEGASRFSDVNTVFLGYFTLAIALLAVIRCRERMVKIWAREAVLFALFCLGPVLQVNRRYVFDMDGIPVTLPMPFAVLHYVPVFRANRVPNRFSVLLTLALAVMVAYGLRRIVASVSRRFSFTFARMVGGALIALIIFDHLSIPLPLTDARVPGPLVKLGEETGDFAVLQLPLGWRNSFGMAGAERTQAQYYQTVHHKRLLAGNISRNPPFQFDYFLRIPFFQAIVAAETYEEIPPELEEKAAAQASELAYLYDIRYVAVLPPVMGRRPYADTYTRTLELVERIMPMELAFEGDGVKVYRVLQPSPPSSFEVDMGVEKALPYLGMGWDRNEEIAGTSAVWAVSRKAEVFVPLREVADYRVTLRASPFTYPGAPPQRMEAYFNGFHLGSVEMAPGWNEYTFTIPARTVRKGLNRLVLRFAHQAVPRKVLPAQLAVGETGVNVPADVEIHAHRDFAYITVGGENASLNKPGLNIALVDASTGKVLDMRVFGFEKGEALASFLAEVPQGTMVLGGSCGDGLERLGSKAIEALRSLGLQGPSGQVGCCYAFIGIKGARPGTAVEVEGKGDAYLRLGRNPDTRPLAAAVDWVRIQR